MKASEPSKDWRESLSALLPDMPPATSDDSAQEQKTAREAAPTKHPRLDVLLDRKGRKGKAATIVAGFTLDDAEVEEVARRLKQRLGVGGSSRGGEILIQGDKRREVADALADLGFKARII